ncbi:MAG TPA: response regulator transcription factor [Terracidiphilus sp.]
MGTNTLDFAAAASCQPDMAGGCLKVLVADDHPVVRKALVDVINNEPDMRVICESGNGRDAVMKAVAERPDVCLLDLRMPGMDGIQAMKSIQERDLNTRLVIFSSYNTQEDVYRAIEAGAQGYVLKEAPVEDIVASVRTVAGGGIWIPNNVGAKLAKRISDHDLTPREREVLRVLASGKSNKEIGAIFNISEATVKVHVTHILEKLHVSCRAEAIPAAAKRGLVRIE